ncbi:MAG: hypothetical protein WC734_00945 [Patescibacteria group bacterium]|jgi:hypothetical protein
MKKALQQVVITKQFDAVIAFAIFIMITLGIDYAIGMSFSASSILADTVISLAVAGVVYSNVDGKKLTRKVIKQRSDHFLVAGMLAIGFLLFCLFLISYILE